MRADLLQRLVAPLERRVRALAARASITRVDDDGLSQRVQITVLAGERLDQAVRVQNFGLSSNPPAGSTALLISVGGSRTHCVVLGADHASRPRDLAAGESQHYNQWGDYVYLQQSGETLVRGRAKVTVDAPLTHALGDMIIGGSLLVEGAIVGLGTLDAAGAIASETSVSDPLGDLAEMRTVHNTHRHTGVDTGSGTSGLTTVPMT